MSKKELSPEAKSKCRELADLIIPHLRCEAAKVGYCIAVHGSLQRDIDLVAIPWTSKAVSACALAEILRKAAEEVNPLGLAMNRDKQGAANPEYFDHGCPGGKPHGRRCWSFHLGGGPYIDLSVMPRADYEDPIAAIKEDC